MPVSRRGKGGGGILACFGDLKKCPVVAPMAQSACLRAERKGGGREQGEI